MIRNSLLVLLLLCCGYHTYSQTIFASTSFEEPAVAAGVQYVDAGDAAINNAGQPPVDYTSTGSEIGFDATFITGGTMVT